MIVKVMHLLQMDNLPEDIQHLIWKKVYDGVLPDIYGAYLKFAERRFDTLKKEQDDYEQRYWWALGTLNKRFMDTLPWKYLRKKVNKIIRGNSERLLTLLEYEATGFYLLFEALKETGDTTAKTFYEYMYDEWNKKEEFTLSYHYY